MKTIYIDRQIFIDSCAGDDEINGSIYVHKENGFTFPYSPAHIEEIYKLMFSGRGGDVAGQINHLRNISDEFSFMPNETGPVALCRESIVQCLRRVKAKSGRELTEKAIKVEADKIQFINQAYIKDKKYWKAKYREVQKAHSDTVFLDQDMLATLEQYAIKTRFRAYGDDFSSRERNIEILFNTLNLFGFKPEHNTKRAENRLHDMSHCIYGSFADIFVTNDKKLRETSKAIFTFLRIRTLIVDRDEFIKISGEFRDTRISSITKKTILL